MCNVRPRCERSHSARNASASSARRDDGGSEASWLKAAPSQSNTEAPIKHGRCPIKHGRFLIKHGRSRSTVTAQLFESGASPLRGHLPAAHPGLPGGTACQLRAAQAAIVRLMRRQQACPSLSPPSTRRCPRVQPGLRLGDRRGSGGAAPAARGRRPAWTGLGGRGLGRNFGRLTGSLRSEPSRSGPSRSEPSRSEPRRAGPIRSALWGRREGSMCELLDYTTLLY